MVAVVQTAGDLANWHPHVHALVSRGGWTGDWQWVRIAYVDENAAELFYRHKVMRMLQGEGLLTEERNELLLSWRHTGFSVLKRVRVEPEDRRAVERLVHYIMRPPISLERIESRGDGEVLYRPKGGHDGRSRHPGDPAEAFEKDVHIHVPASAIPKDGPSASVTMATALMSALSGRPARNDVAMTGEITLSGRVLPIGGVKEKILGAVRAGISTIVLPKVNEAGLEDLPEEISNTLTFHLVEELGEALAHTLRGGEFREGRLQFSGGFSSRPSALRRS